MSDVDEKADEEKVMSATSRKSSKTPVAASGSVETEEEEVNLMSLEEREEDLLLSKEMEEKKRLIELTIQQHHEWKEDYDIKREVVMKRWKQLNDKRDHRKFIEQMMT